MTADEDKRLVDATLRGDADAFATLVDRYQKPIYNASYGITLNREDALEASQATFVKVWDRLETFDPSFRFFSWIYRIAVNEAIDLVHRRQRFVDEEPDGERLPTHQTPERDYAQNEASERVRGAIARLKPDQRVVVELKHFQGLSYREISTIVEIPEKTVKSRLFSARRELRELLFGLDLHR
jgi:RNA polymerase sigma-70 factor (ECF subfamily)